MVMRLITTIIIGFFNINGKRWRASEEKFGKIRGIYEFG